MTQEQKEKSLARFFKALGNIGIDTECLKEKYGEKLMNAPFKNNNEEGLATEGTLLDTIVMVLTPYAVKLNELLPEEKRVPKEKIVKVCLLHHIAKAVKLIPNDNAWEIEKRGILFKYDNDLPSIRTGLHSLAMAQECGITFDLDEVEAMTVNDMDLQDPQTRFHAGTLATIVRMANEMTYTQFKK